ncbi:hypothetical protein [Saccharothrix deserti]|uniref:hypothetical protein n=1 Tax=Saccharothrix deserti TaxID=2593674 RepID=UPI00131EA501|nr:hypothetical protein [Saccharothrix deserti]
MTWTHLRHAPVPFGELAWDHARQVLAERGANAATEAEIAAAATALLNRAEHGPDTTSDPSSSSATTRSRRVTGRTKATNTPAWPRPDIDEPTEPVSGSEDTEDEHLEGEQLAKVIPLGVFDPFEEATKRW